MCTNTWLAVRTWVSLYRTYVAKKTIPKLLKLKMTRELRKFWGGKNQKSVHPIWLAGKCLSKLSNASTVILTCTETPLHEAISAACWCIKRIITYTHQDLVHKIEMLALFCARKHSQHGASREERKTVNSQHGAGKEMGRSTLKSRKINRAEPKFSEFVWLSSPRLSSPCGICWLDFRSRKFKEKTNLNTLHVTGLVQPE